MFTTRSGEDNFIIIIRWAARTLGALCIGAMLLFIFSVGPNLMYVGWEDLGVILLFPLGFLTGLILAWQEEIKGGVLAIASVIAFYLLYDLAFGGSMRQGAWILFFAVPGLLFLMHGLLSSRVTNELHDGEREQSANRQSGASGALRQTLPR
jgi:hypothetical protein